MSLDESLNNFFDTIKNTKQYISAAYEACDLKSASIPSEQNIENLASCINSIFSPSGTRYITANGTYNVERYFDANVNVSDSEHFAYGYKTMTANADFEVTGLTDQQGKTFTPKGYAFMLAPSISENTNILNSTNGLVMCFFDTVNNIMFRNILHSSAYQIRCNPNVSSGSVSSGKFTQKASSSVIYNCMRERYFWIAWG